MKIGNVINFGKANKVPLTDRNGKTIYVNAEDRDKYVLTNKGWLLKDKVYTELGKKYDFIKMQYVFHIFKRTGWEIHLEELERQRQWKEELKPYVDWMNTPEGKAKMAEYERIMYEKNPELKKNIRR